MSKKLILVLTGVILLLSFRVVFASPIINEIMYDLDGSDIDWVEIYNPDSTDLDLTTLKLLISNSTSNHGIASSSGSSVLHQGEYGVIVPTSQVSAFNSKWGSSGNIFTSAYTLSNDTGKVEINNGDKNVPLDSIVYNSTQGASGDGKSLQLVDSSWIVSNPTPRVLNQTSGSNDNNNNTDNTNTNNTNNNTDTTTSTSTSSKSSNSITSAKKVPVTHKIKTEITTKPLAYVGIPFMIEGNAFGTQGEQLFDGKYFWNFGDGDSREVKIINTDRFYHTYFYPGEYTIIFEYYPEYYSIVPDAVSQVAVKVVSASVSISRVGDVQDFFVELTNNTNYPADLSNWFLASQTKIFTIPHNTVLAPKKTMLISGRITNFSLNDKDTLQLLNPQKMVAFDYTSSLASKVATSNPNVSAREGTTILVNTENKNSALNLEAVALESDVLNQEMDGVSSSPFIPIVSAIFVGAGASAVYFVRKKSRIRGAGNDFEILDE
jgi:hypothetical protein